ncbi:MAGE family-domain-containing protein [Penicillium verhagenii]|uniref:MAGE family-domain-containing protein n=1 Tax=Penicillium verhagenii TaxID=1562060 RepID=UPI0025455D45|nr:MAGE family-domain-containing protein [Penicillium verhagenii]KAJ5936662.1 MAGE family-domain-containing protein [Penicillium verhagenii]
MVDIRANSAHTSTSIDSLVKKMVNLALAKEHKRLPIKREDITSKVLVHQERRMFKTVFQHAQLKLMDVFGMEMTELPPKQDITTSQRRATQKIKKHSTRKSWILSTTLPPKYRTPSILIPTKAPSANEEAIYTGLYTFIIAVITLNGPSLNEDKLMRYLKRAKADVHTPIDRTDKLINRLCRDRYLVRTREVDENEDVVLYMVGPRGRIEVGSKGVDGLVEEVFRSPPPSP